MPFAVTADPTLPAGYSALSSTRYAQTLAEAAASTAEPYRDIANPGPTDPTITPWPGNTFYQQYSPSVVYFEGAYYMYVTLVQCSVNVGTRDDEIFVWRSTDGITWTWGRTNVVGQASPVIGQGVGYWETTYIADACVLVVDGVIHMYYSSCSYSYTDYICHATSTDGINFEKDIYNPVLSPTPGEWDAVRTARPSVVHDGATFHLFYDGLDTDYVGDYHVKVGYAFSVDGSHFSKSLANPVIDTADYGNVDAIIDVGVELYEGTFYLVPRFSGRNLGHPYTPLFTSPDGESWTKGRDFLNFNADIGENQIWTPELYNDPNDGNLYVVFGQSTDYATVRLGRALVGSKVEIVQNGVVVETPWRSRKSQVLFETTGILWFRYWNAAGTDYVDSGEVTIPSHQFLATEVIPSVVFPPLSSPVGTHTAVHGTVTAGVSGSVVIGGDYSNRFDLSLDGVTFTPTVTVPIGTTDVWLGMTPGQEDGGTIIANIGVPE